MVNSHGIEISKPFLALALSKLDYAMRCVYTQYIQSESACNIRLSYLHALEASSLTLKPAAALMPAHALTPAVLEESCCTHLLLHAKAECLYRMHVSAHPASMPARQ